MDARQDQEREEDVSGQEPGADLEKRVVSVDDDQSKSSREDHWPGTSMPGQAEPGVNAHCPKQAGHEEEEEHVVGDRLLLQNVIDGKQKAVAQVDHPFLPQHAAPNGQSQLPRDDKKTVCECKGSGCREGEAALAQGQPGNCSEKCDRLNQGKFFRPARGDQAGCGCKYSRDQQDCSGPIPPADRVFGVGSKFEHVLLPLIFKIIFSGYPL